ncbi:MAG: ribonuclease III [Oscillospiraceae bacterium]|jgi:ribonuclease-3|nr:ribonuclease III [Oscillospiraceae bacterium]
MDAFEKKIGYRFSDPDLLRTALTHSSYANENKHLHIDCNERLEFLGDSILGATVAAFLYKSVPKLSEGQMTRLRAELVCERSLAAAAAALDLGAYLLLGRGEDTGGGRRRPSLLADAMEAVFAAVYLDGGADSTVKLIEVCILTQIKREKPVSSDFKTALQELVQKKSGQSLSYHLTGEDGPDHQKTFSVEVQLNGEKISAGTGKSKKEAEQRAARGALEAFGE